MIGKLIQRKSEIQFAAISRFIKISFKILIISSVSRHFV